MTDTAPDAPALTIAIDEADFDAATRARVKAAAAGTVVLGDTDDARRVIFDALPKVIARRLEQITPPDFTISEVTVTMNLSGVVFGVGLAGDVTVKFAPAAR